MSNISSTKRYFVIHRPIMNSSWIIRELQNGNTEILKLTEEYYEEDIGNSERIEINDEVYFWQEWADKKLFKEVWLGGDDGENDAVMNEFTELTDAIEHLEEEC